ncbi:MAG: ArsB/NhaD family transporter [Dehalococcoidales bacterium]|nr:MAG: ArsB/NhaD family transporter [Dehalococcoidales bacterium]
MELSQIFALVIFVGMFIAVVSDKWHRYIPALVGAGLTVIVVFLIILKSPQAVLDTLSLGQLTEQAFWWVQPGGELVESHQGVNWQTIIFIGGMMVMVEGLGEVGFFRWLCLRLAKLVNYKVVPILVVFMLLSGFLAMFIDSITVLLFLATVTIELARLLKFDPVPIIIAEIFASNVGGSATMCGDPPNVIIGTAFGYTFFDFATNTGPIAWIGMLATLAFFYFAFRKVLTASHGDTIIDPSTYPEPGEAITNMNLFRINTGIFLLIVVLLVTHAQTGISVALIGVIAAALTLLAGFRGARHILERVDWRTLLFFIGLFICVGGLEVTGMLEKLAEFIAEVSGGNITVVIPIILWISAIASGLVDNIPFAATMIPVLRGLAQTTAMKLPTLAWTLALGTDIGGNATPIGASANVVGTAVAQREGYRISWGRFCKYAIPAAIMVLGLCWLYLVVRYT